MNRGERADDRRVLAITGQDRLDFLQGLVTNDVAGLGGDLVYAALLSPQGKYLFDFFLFHEGEAVFLDIAASRADALKGRLMLYRLRADVAIGDSRINVSRGLGEVPEGARADPRHPALGWRRYSEQAGTNPAIDWDAIRVENMVPETGAELIENESYILELGFERLHGVDFRKGCYVGQEVTARMKHKTELRKGLARVSLSHAVTPGSAILRGDKQIGSICTTAGATALAYLRYDQAGDGMKAGGADVSLLQHAADSEA